MFPKDTAMVSFSFKAHATVSASTKKPGNKIR